MEQNSTKTDGSSSRLRHIFIAISVLTLLLGLALGLFIMRWAMLKGKPVSSSVSPLKQALSSRTWVRVVVLDSDGRFVAGQKVSLNRVSSFSSASLLTLTSQGELGVTTGALPYPAEVLQTQQLVRQTLLTVTTNEQGEASFELNVKGYYLVNAGPLYSSSTVYYDPVQPNAESSIRLVLVPERQVGSLVEKAVLPNRIRWIASVVSNKNVPIERAIVRIVVGEFQTTLVSEQGGVIRADLPLGEAKIWIEHPDYVPLNETRTLTDFPHQGKVVFHLESGRFLSGIVLDSFTRFPLPKAQIAVESNGFRKIVYPNSSGRFYVQQAPLGTVTLQVQCPGYAALSKQMTSDDWVQLGAPLELLLERLPD